MSYQNLYYSSPGVYQSVDPTQGLSGALSGGTPPQWSPYSTSSPDAKLQPPYSTPPIGQPRQRRLVVLIAALTLAIFSVNFAFILGLIAYISIVNTATISGMRLLTTGSINVINTITQGALKAMSLSVPLVMSLYAYRAAALWLRQGAAGGPTPTQLGLSLSVLGSANIMALVRGVPRLSRRTPLLASFLRGALINLFVLLTLDSTISAISLIFNVTTIPALVPGPFSYSADAMNMSQGINETLCTEWATRFNRSADYARYSCGVYDPSSSGGRYYQGQVIRTLQNTSDSQAVAWTDQSIAILTSPNSSEFSYSAATTGIKTTCRSVTSSCANCSWSTNGYLSCLGPYSGMTLNCPAGGVKYNTSSGSGTYQGGVLDANGTVSTGSSIIANPFQFGAVVTSQTYTTDPRVGDRDFYNRTGWAVAQRYQLNVLLCDVEVLDVEYVFEPPAQYTAIRTTPVDLRKAKLIAQTADDSRIPSLVEPVVDGAGILPGMTYVDAYGQQLSKVLLGMASRVHEPQPTKELLGHRQAGSDMSIILLVVHLGLSTIFALYLLAMGCLSAATCGSDPLVEAVQAYLVSPLHLIQQLHGSPSTKPDALHKAVGEDIFACEYDRDRLSIGPQLAYDGSWYLASRRG